MTRAFVLIWLTAVTAMPVSAHAMGSARELADDCRTLLKAKRGAGEQIQIPFTKKALVCWGYMQAMQDLSVLADEDGRMIMGACPPQRTTLLQLIQAFVNYTRSHELPCRAGGHPRVSRSFSMRGQPHVPAAVEALEPGVPVR